MANESPPNALAGLGAYYSGNALTFSLDAEIGRLVTRHGAQAVREAVKRGTAMRKGRKPEKDWLLLREWIELDARDWLDGGNPFKLRTNYFLAKQVSTSNPGHNNVATHRRIMGKLSKRRKVMILLAAWEIAESARPFADYFRTVEAIATADIKWGDAIQSIADRKRGQLERYRERFGEPEQSMSIAEVEEALKAPAMNALSPNALGMFAGRRR